MLEKKRILPLGLLLAGCSAITQQTIPQETLQHFSPLELEAYHHCQTYEEISDDHIEVVTCELSSDGQHMVVISKLRGSRYSWNWNTKQSFITRKSILVCAVSKWRDWLQSGHTAQFQLKGEGGFATPVFDEAFCQAQAEAAKQTQANQPDAAA